MILFFAGPMVSVATTLSCHLSAKAAIGNTEIFRGGRLDTVLISYVQHSDYTFIYLMK